MKGKLIKTEVNYLLEGEGGIVIASTSLKKEGMSLSIKNCQAIELGYDLDELFNDVDESIDYHEFDFTSFRLGFQKALELMVNKKFSEEDIREAYSRGQTNSPIQSLQQTEWDVAIEMICPHPSDTYRCGIQYGCDEDGCNHPNQVPYLDADGCLILKRI